MAEREFKLPDLGEGLTEGEVVRWLVAEGDSVVLNQPIVEVETASGRDTRPCTPGRWSSSTPARATPWTSAPPWISVDTGGGAAGGRAAPAEGGETAQPAQAPVAAEPEQELQATLVGPGERQQGPPPPHRRPCPQRQRPSRRRPGPGPAWAGPAAPPGDPAGAATPRTAGST